ncbi:uncharacterized protein [Lolium perenne]|uniref:uncharacterized protein n=1 Tax=Lolium perenne TaxID=4522 RepID=UPI0021EAEED2|nr:uncharacterized protein LOC127344150 [Lolium perenne]
MAAEARAESPAPAAPPPPVPEKRAAPPDDVDDEERPGPKRRRAFVATLDGVPCAAAAAAAEEDGQRDGLSFSFQHSRGGFVPLETTPKFGSFNPPAPAEQQEAPDLNPAPPAAEDSPAVEEDGEDPASPRGVGDHQDGNSEAVAAEVDQGEPECADVHHP